MRSSRLARSLAVSAAALVTLGAAIRGADVGAQVCDGCRVARQTVTKSDRRLLLTDAEKAESERRHLLGGRYAPPPGATREHMIHQREWVTWYDDDLRIPLWVSYELTKADARAHVLRKDCFRQDPRLAADVSSTCDDYAEPVFDRGHMVPNADLERSRYATTNSFVFSNMVPQRKAFNRGIWATLEKRVRSWAVVADGVYVVTGVVFDRDGDGRRDADAADAVMAPTNRVAIPTHFYKIVVHVRPSGFADTISILLPHTAGGVGAADPYLKAHITTVDEIEALTGIDFFPDLPDDREAALESFKAPGLWSTH